MNNENLKSFGDGSRSPEDEKSLQSKGGKKSGETRKRRKNMKQIATELLNMPPGSDVAEKLDEMKVPKDEQTNMMAIIISMIVKAIEGDVRAATFLRDTISENPSDKIRESDMKHRHKLDEQRLDLEAKRLAFLISKENGFGDLEDLSDAEREIYGIEPQEMEKGENEND